MSELDDEQGDVAAEAFEGLRGEVALIRKAVERLAAERAAIDVPDYSETLGQMAQALGATVARVDVLAKATADNVAPRYVADRIVAAGGHVRDEDQRMIAGAGNALKEATRSFQDAAQSARRHQEQNRMLAFTAGGGVVLGLLFYAAFAGSIARAMPESWQWPERMATGVLGEKTAWDAGQRLMQRAAPRSWAMIVAADPLADGNRDTIQRCRKAATKERKPVRCTIQVKVGPQS